MNSYGYTIFCDDIRQEVGSKLTFVGAYSADLNFTDPPPSALMKLCFFSVVYLAPEQLGETIRYVVYGNKEEVLFQTEQSIAVDAAKKLLESQPPEEDSPKFVQMAVAAMIAPFPLSEGRVRVRAYVGDILIKLGSLRLNYAGGAAG